MRATRQTSGGEIHGKERTGSLPLKTIKTVQ